MIVEYTSETRQQIMSVLIWYFYTYRFIDISKEPTPETLNMIKRECHRLYNIKNSELKKAVNTAMSRIDDMILKKESIEKQ